MKAYLLIAIVSLLCLGMADTTVTVTVFPTVVETVYPPWATELSGAALSTYISIVSQTFSSTSSTLATSTSTTRSSSSSAPYTPSSSSTLVSNSEPSAAAGDAGASPNAAAENVAGASGSGSSFALPSGAVAAIVSVVVIVVVLGAASAILFVLAKRRQWNVRASIARASRRLTGRSAKQPHTDAAATTAARRSGRTFTNRENPTRADRPQKAPWQGHRRGRDASRADDIEKGPLPLQGKAPQNTRPREKSWVGRLWGNGWK